MWMVECNGMPTHPMMVGITSWQQQVPTPQAYVGDNAWRIPAAPVMAETPVSGKTELYRGAIALAVEHMIVRRQCDGVPEMWVTPLAASRCR